MQFLISFLFLLGGSFLYIIFRPDVLFLLPFENAIDEIPPFEIQHGIVAYTIIYNLPDALWYAAILFLQKNPWKTKWNWIAVFTVSLPFIHELCQLTGVLPGTFDLADLLFYIITLTIFLIIWKKEISSKRGCSNLVVS